MRPLLLLTALLLATPALAAPTLLEHEARGLRAIEPSPEADAPSFVLTGGKVMTATGDVFESGFVVVRDGRIQAVGEGAGPDVPGATVLDVTGQVVTPGLIDTHSHLGVYPSPWAQAHSDGNEATAPATAGVWAEHSLWPQDPGWQRAVAGGVTAALVLPGSANLIGGRGVVVQIVPTRGSRAMRFPGAPEHLKMACGENPKRVYGSKGGPSTRMGNLRTFRSAFLAAQKKQVEWDEAAKKAEDKGKKKRWGKKKAEPGDDDDKGPDRDYDLETLIGLMEGRIHAQIHCYRADDMLSVLQVADEFGWKVRSFHHALEAYKIRDVLAANDVAINTWADWWGFKLEAYDAIEENVAMMHDAGGRAVVHSDSAIGIQRLNQEAGKALASGRAMGLDLSDDDALRWVTANPAWVLGIDDVTGTLSAGKRADIVVWDADPLSVYSKAKWVFIDGRLRFDVDRPQTWSDFELGQEVTR